MTVYAIAVTKSAVSNLEPYFDKQLQNEYFE